MYICEGEQKYSPHTSQKRTSDPMRVMGHPTWVLGTKQYVLLPAEPAVQPLIYIF